MKNNIKLIILCIILGATFAFTAFFGVSLALEIRANRQGEEFFAEMPVDFLPRIAVLPVPIILDEPTDEPILEEEPTPKPEPFLPLLDFDELRESFPSIVGWIQSEGTIINYPIVQGRDNDFYLRRLPDRTSHIWGSIYMDFRNASDFSDTNIVIYGHNMRAGGGAKFGTLRYYGSQTYFENHPSMFIFTPYSNYVLMLFAGYTLDATREVPPMRFTNEAHFDRFIDDILRRSIFQSDVRPNYGDTIVFLATCTDGGSDNERLIIAGVLHPIAI